MDKQLLKIIEKIGRNFQSQLSHFSKENVFFHFHYYDSASLKFVATIENSG